MQIIELEYIEEIEVENLPEVCEECGSEKVEIEITVGEDGSQHEVKTCRECGCTEA